MVQVGKGEGVGWFEGKGRGEGGGREGRVEQGGAGGGWRC